MSKPRVTWKYYPKLKRGFWRVLPMPRTRTLDTYRLWRIAHAEVSKANNREQPARGTTKEMNNGPE